MSDSALATQAQPISNLSAVQDAGAKKPASHQSAPECMMISEKQFMRDHTRYSAMSSWLFAIAGATNIGVLCAISSKVLMAAEQGKPIFKSNDPAVKPVMSNKKYNRIALSMTGFGAVCMAVSNWLESKKVVTEWQLGAGKLQRKANIAKKEQEEIAAADAGPAVAPAAHALAAGIPAAPPHSKNWVASLQPNVHVLQK